MNPAATIHSKVRYVVNGTYQTQAASCTINCQSHFVSVTSCLKINGSLYPAIANIYKKILKIIQPPSKSIE